MNVDPGSTTSFYSKKNQNVSAAQDCQESSQKEKLWPQKLEKYQELADWYKKHPLIPEYIPRLLNDPSPLWHTFPRQKQAFDFAASHPEDVHIFAFEKEETAPDSASQGVRRYLATTYPQLWHIIHHMTKPRGTDPGKHATFYEVIPEGAACKLYFDLEFIKEVNPEHDGNEMVKIFKEFVCQQINDEFKLKCSQRHVIDLDASTDSKFSRHLIFNLPGAVFKDNINAGNFVQRICSDILKQIGASKDTDEDGEKPSKKPRLESEITEEALQCLVVKNKNGEDVLFVDTGVYTRNRNFRLYRCSKLGKSNPLVVASSNTYIPKLDKKTPRNKRTEERQMFVDSIISNVKYSADIQVLCFKGDASKTKNSSSQSERTGTSTGENDESTSDKSLELLEGFHHSPYPDIDNFIKTCVREGGIQGEIRRWLYFTQGQTLVYDICKNRWCGNINRQHKSNNIMILVHLKRGVYYQKCHDPDCKAQNYKSPEHPIPPDFLPAFFDEFDDDDLLAATEHAEQMQVAENVGSGQGAVNGVKFGGARSNGGGGDAGNPDGGDDGEGVGWQEGVLDITDEEMLAAVSELEDSGIEN